MPTTPATSSPPSSPAAGRVATDDDSAATGTVTVRYWAAAKAAAGVATEDRAAGTVGAVLAAARADHRDLGPVLAVASVLLDGRPTRDDDEVAPGSTLEVLPPFAGG